MPKYCDSDVLERNWFDWTVSSSVSDLEVYRVQGFLWTKVSEKVRVEGKVFTKTVNGVPVTFDDPRSAIQHHYFGVGRGILATTDSGHIVSVQTTTGRSCRMPLELSPQTLRRLVGPGSFDSGPIEKIGFRRQRPTPESWHAVLGDVYGMCRGIAMRFTLPSDEERANLAHDATIQVMRKLEGGKLHYTPGMAPVFNLLTTTIHRCMFSALSRDRRRLHNAARYAEEFKAQHAGELGQGSIVQV